MAHKFASLADIDIAISNQFAPLELDLNDGKPPVKLVNAMQLPKKVRKEFTDTLSALEGEGGLDDFDKAEDTVLTALQLTVLEPGDKKRFSAAIDGNLARAIRIMELYQEDTQLGEA